ncbi:MAG: TIGR03084 family metal-binding protein, partial [Actinomycetota bacterium]|nr:TIGR03084 family metal-binding protein [Actinomycetota bacterium]
MAAVILAELCSELNAEQWALDKLVAGADGAAWATSTPAAGWDVRDQISHLRFFDQAALVALTDPPAFARHAKGLMAAGGESRDVALGRSLSGPEVLERWRASRHATRVAALAAAEADPKTRVPWYGPPMSLASFVTARLMETWAHGTDVADALGYAPVASDRLRHVCTIGIKARPYAFMIHERTDPGDPVHFDVAAPGGWSGVPAGGGGRRRREGRWRWGPEGTTDRVSGAALDLALVFTQRRHLSDTDLVVEGPTARAWMEIAQAFAGPAGPGRRPASDRR